MGRGAPLCAQFMKEGEFMWILKVECRHILQSAPFRIAVAVTAVVMIFSALSNGSNSLFMTKFGPNALGQGGILFLILTGIAVGRSLGGSLHEQMPQMQYTGKFGRKLVLYKLIAVGIVSGATYLTGGLFITLLSLSSFRLDLYWNIPLSSAFFRRSDEFFKTPAPAFPATAGQFWWFQLAVGLAAVLIMAVLFSAVILLVKKLYAGTAVMVCLTLYLLFPLFGGSSLLFYGDPITLFLNAPYFPKSERVFPILPWFEGGALLFWCGVAAILATLGFVRFRKAAL